MQNNNISKYSSLSNEELLQLSFISGSVHRSVNLNLYDNTQNIVIKTPDLKFSIREFTLPIL